MLTPVDREEATHLAARAGRLLLTNGAATAHVIRRIDEVASLLGHPVHALVTPEAILIGEAGKTTHARVGHAITAMGVDVGRLIAVEHVIDKIRDGLRDAAQIDRLFDAIETRADGYPPALACLGLAITAASLARLFDATWPVAAAAFAAGLVGTALRITLARRGTNALAAFFVVALLSGVVAALAVQPWPGASPVLALTAAGMILVPGVPLLNGVRDLVDGHSSNAVARLAFGTAILLTIGFALFLATAITGTNLPVGAAPGSLPLIEDMLFSATAAAGYSILFNLPMRALPFSILCGIAGHSLRTALTGYGIDIATGSLIGALAAGLIALVAGRVFRAAPVAIAFPGIVSMIPGSYAFRAGIGGLHLMALGRDAPAPLVAETIGLAITTVVVVTAIAIGLMLALAIPLDRIRILAKSDSDVRH